VAWLTVKGWQRPRDGNVRADLVDERQSGGSGELQ
jgi:hypothetical protein